MFSIFKRFADNQRAGSLADRLRKKRLKLFLAMLHDLPRPVKVLDVGGTGIFWERMAHSSLKGVKITLFNLNPEVINKAGFEGIQGDARDMKMFAYKEFDIAFSNSVIEHLTTFEDQRLMAEEMKRVATGIFLQTPNKWFPLEPHTLFPFFQFLPLKVKVWLIMHFNLGWYKKISDKNRAEQECLSIRLMNRAELRSLFPGATIKAEKFLGLTKSFIVLNY